MPKRKGGTTRSLTIYLLKDEEGGPYVFMKADPVVREHVLLVEEDNPWPFFIKALPPKPPRWAPFFSGYLDPGAVGTVSGVAAALLLPAVGRWWAITFGQGRHLLNEGSFEERFGLRVVLNTVGEEGLKSIDKETFDAMAGHARQQAIMDVSAHEFGIDIERDLLWAVTGTPEDNRFGLRISGRDALFTFLQIDLPELPVLLERLYLAHEDKSYQDKFLWVDNIYEVKERELRDKLNSQLVESLRKNELEKTWLSPPEVLDWSQVRSFSYSDGSRAPSLYDIHWKTFFQLAVRDQAKLDLDSLKQRSVFCFGEDDVLINRWSVYRCIYAETEYQGGSYILSAGKWYRLADSFVQEVNRSVELIELLDGFLPIYDDESEEEYNKRVAKQEPDRYVCLDRRLISYGGGKSRIEVCDLMSRDLDIIHVKRYSGSRDLSHLFSQGLNSGELFQIDKDFRLAVNDKLPQDFQIASVEERPQWKRFRVVFAVVSQSRGPLALPFFSKLSLRHAARKLEGYGYRVALAKVEVDELRKTLKNFT